MMARSKVKADVRLKDFWRQNDRFADLFNAVVFEGKEVIKPDSLQEMDTDMSGIIQFPDYEESVVRIRDVVKKMAYGVEFVVMGIDNQMKIHYGMPLRALLYDGLGYLKEYQEIAKQRKSEGGKVTEDEFLSKIRKEDRLHPIITIVIYYNEKPWDGPLCLRDMMVEMPEEISRIFSDYKMNLVQVRDSDRYVFNNEDVKTVFEISREIFRGNLDQITQKYNRDIDAELAAVIGQITDSNEITRQASEKEVVNMCTALEKWEKQAEEHGAEKNQREIILKLLKKGYNAEQIEDLLDVPSSRVLIIQKESE